MPLLQPNIPQVARFWVYMVVAQSPYNPSELHGICSSKTNANTLIKRLKKQGIEAERVAITLDYPYMDGRMI